PAADGRAPTRYHRLDVDLRHVALAPALAIHVGDLRIGVSTRVLFSTGLLSFDEDTALDRGAADPGCGGAPCGVENPDAAARYRVRSGNGTSTGPFADAQVSFVVAGGLFYRRRRWDFGLSYASRPLGAGVDGVRIAAGRTTIDRPARDGG